MFQYDSLVLSTTNENYHFLGTNKNQFECGISCVKYTKKELI